MADAKSNKALSLEAAEAVLTAIKEAAPTYNRNASGLESLAHAYSLVIDGMPKRDESTTGRVGRAG